MFVCIVEVKFAFPVLIFNEMKHNFQNRTSFSARRLNLFFAFPSLFFSPVEHSMDFLFVSLLSFGVWWVRSFALRLRYVMAMLYGIIWIYVRLSLSLSLCEFVVVVDSNKKCISVTKSNKTSQLIWRYCCFSFIRFFFLCLTVVAR